MTSTESSKKRSLTPPLSDSLPSPTTRETKRARRQSNSNNNNNSNDLLTELTQVLAEIKSTPSSGEISADLLETLKLLMLQIERLSADETNEEAVQMKHESEKCLEGWFDDLLARCEADGELDLETLEEELAAAGDDDDDMDAALSLALALAEEEEEEEEEEDHQQEENLLLEQEQEEEVKGQDVNEEIVEEVKSPAIQQVIV
ncbi:hypothetical protein BDC45DRAFT_563830 [Circinella umbellata]|nr:hypothetical protein BDC45DRAFT_563830 [Circinella umbellata]